IDRIRRLHRELGIGSIAELEAAARNGRLQSVKGWGPAFQNKVLQSIALSRATSGRHIHRASIAMEYVRSDLLAAHPKWTVFPAGELRRGCELVSKLVLVAVDPHRAAKMSRRTVGDEVILHIASPQLLGAALLLATGSEDHIAALRKLARARNLTLDDGGLRSASRIVASETEEEIYAALGLPFIPPELRESGREIALALQGKLATLVAQEHIHGVLHAHTDQSDGADSLEDMARAAHERGYGYLGLTDHSQTAHYAGGLKAGEVSQQQRAIDAINRRLGSIFHVFKGIESDILADGSLDYEEKVLKTFDLIVASVHSRFRMSREEQTARIVKAVENPYTTILGHVTGRLLLRRPGYDLDVEKVLAACAARGVAVEINANPWRLDLDWRWCQRALDLGCMLSINPDAHATEEIDNIRWGVLMARKGAVPKDRVLNSLSTGAFAAYLRDRKRRAARSR
ncbi:MAG: DNA polymerase/3'-5' exonuclease PolX, partial [Gammaproteobacteria bacterium]|nr:DNA polymerase/3'-5' exonuclease PolX [Gammaproteobacteria bacterium]